MLRAPLPRGLLAPPGAPLEQIMREYTYRSLAGRGLSLKVVLTQAKACSALALRSGMLMDHEGDHHGYQHIVSHQ